MSNKHDSPVSFDDLSRLWNARVREWGAMFDAEPDDSEEAAKLAAMTHELLRADAELRAVMRRQRPNSPQPKPPTLADVIDELRDLIADAHTQIGYRDPNGQRAREYKIAADVMRQIRDRLLLVDDQHQRLTASTNPPDAPQQASDPAPLPENANGTRSRWGQGDAAALVGRISVYLVNESDDVDPYVDHSVGCDLLSEAHSALSSLVGEVERRDKAMAGAAQRLSHLAADGDHDTRGVMCLLRGHQWDSSAKPYCLTCGVPKGEGSES